MSEEGFAFCNHCGAMWDDNHERNGCPVMGTTARILGATDEQADAHQCQRKTGLKERIKAVVSGRSGGS